MAISHDSERKSASSACNIHFVNARKSVGNYGVFSLSFGTFLSLYLATKEKEKDISKKTFYLKTILTFSSLKKQEEKVSKKKKLSKFSTTLRLWFKWM